MFDDWKKEYYGSMESFTTCEMEFRTRDVERSAILHSLRKWVGLRARNLRKHGMILGRMEDKGNWFIDDGEANGILINNESCALCQISRDPQQGHRVRCVLCPISQFAKTTCDSTIELSDEDKEYNLFTAWDFWRSRCDPEPMIKALVATYRNFTRAFGH